jgi:hypothetical protein
MVRNRHASLKGKKQAAILPLGKNVLFSGTFGFQAA